MSKDLPLSFEEQLRRDCPAVFQLHEVATGFQVRKHPDLDAETRRAMKPIPSTSVPTRQLPQGYDAEAPGSDPAQMDFDEPAAPAVAPTPPSVKPGLGLKGRMAARQPATPVKTPVMHQGLGSRMAARGPNPQDMVKQLTAHISTLSPDKLQQLQKFLGLAS